MCVGGGGGGGGVLSHQMGKPLLPTKRHLYRTLWYRDCHQVCLVCQALGIKGGTRTDLRPYCPRPPWQLPNHVTLHLNTGHSPAAHSTHSHCTHAILIHSLAKSCVLLMGFVKYIYMTSKLRIKHVHHLHAGKTQFSSTHINKCKTSF